MTIRIADYPTLSVLVVLRKIDALDAADLNPFEALVLNDWFIARSVLKGELKWQKIKELTKTQFSYLQSEIIQYGLYLNQLHLNEVLKLSENQFLTLNTAPIEQLIRMKCINLKQALKLTPDQVEKLQHQNAHQAILNEEIVLKFNRNDKIIEDAQYLHIVSKQDDHRPVPGFGSKIGTRK